MIIDKTLQQGTDAWLEIRKKFITATDAGVIAGISPYKTPYKLWLQKLGIEDPEKENDAMRHGKNNEDTARRLFNLKTNANCVPIVAFCDAFPFMMASIDGYDIDNELVVEIKCPINSKLCFEEIPGVYYAQMQHIMAITSLPICHYVIYYDHNLYCFEVNRDNDYIEELIEKEKEFYKCLMELTPPALSEKDYKPASPEWEKVDSQRRTLRETIKELEEAEKKLKNTLILLAGETNTVGAETRLTKVVQPGRVDYSAIPELKGINIDAYRKPATSYWRLS